MTRRFECDDDEYNHVMFLCRGFVIARTMSTAPMIKVGDRIPEATLYESKGYNDASHCPMPPKAVHTKDIFAQGKV